MEGHTEPCKAQGELLAQTPLPVATGLNSEDVQTTYSLVNTGESLPAPALGESLRPASPWPGPGWAGRPPAPLVLPLSEIIYDPHFFHEPLLCHRFSPTKRVLNPQKRSPRGDAARKAPTHATLLTQANGRMGGEPPKSPLNPPPLPKKKGPDLPRYPPPGPSFTAGRRQLPPPRAAEDLCASVTKGEAGAAATLTAGEEPRAGLGAAEGRGGRWGGPAPPGTERGPGTATGRPRPRGEARGVPPEGPISGAVLGSQSPRRVLGARCHGYRATRCFPPIPGPSGAAMQGPAGGRRPPL